MFHERFDFRPQKRRRFAGDYEVIRIPHKVNSMLLVLTFVPPESTKVTAQCRRELFAARSGLTTNWIGRASVRSSKSLVLARETVSGQPRSFTESLRWNQKKPTPRSYSVIHLLEDVEGSTKAAATRRLNAHPQETVALIDGNETIKRPWKARYPRTITSRRNLGCSSKPRKQSLSRFASLERKCLGRYV